MAAIVPKADGTGERPWFYLLALLKRASTPAEGIAAYLLGALNVGLWMATILTLLLSLGWKLFASLARQDRS